MILIARWLQRTGGVMTPRNAAADPDLVQLRTAGSRAHPPTHCCIGRVLPAPSRQTFFKRKSKIPKIIDPM